MHLIDKIIFLFQISFVCLKRLKIELAHYKTISMEVYIGKIVLTSSCKAIDKLNFWT
jgi:hypothetical protein